MALLLSKLLYMYAYMEFSTPSIGDNPNQLLQCIVSLSLLSFNSRGLYGKEKKLDFKLFEIETKVINVR